MKKSTTVVIVLSSLLFGGIAFANSHLAGEHGEHEAHDSTQHKGGMHQRHHGHAGKTGAMMPMMFGTLDENKDGKLTREEVQKGVDKMFADADANKDVVLTRDEMQLHHKRMHDRVHSKMHDHLKAGDKDGDGALSRAEVDEAGFPMLSRNFDKLDKNKDGKLTNDELRSGMMTHRQSAPSQTK